MDIEPERIRAALIERGWEAESLDREKCGIMAWLTQKLVLQADDVRLNLTRLGYFQLLSDTIASGIVASNAIEGEYVVCDKFNSLVNYTDFQIRQTFRVVTR